MNFKLTSVLLLCLALHRTGLAADAPDLLIADFEGRDNGDWKATGDAFGPGPARGTLPNQTCIHLRIDGQAVDDYELKSAWK